MKTTQAMATHRPDEATGNQHRTDRTRLRNYLMRINRTQLARALAALLLCAGIILLAGNLRFPGVDFDKISRILGDIKQVDAQWSVDIQRLEMGLNGDYDPVSAPLPALRSYYAELQGVMNSYPFGRAQREAVETLLHAYKATMDRKIELVDRIKSQYSIMSNSSRFLPIASRDLVNAINDSGLGPATQVEMKDLLNSIFSQTMSYMLLRDAALGASVQQQTQALEHIISQSPAEVQEKAQSLVLHVRLVLKQREDGNALLVELAKLPTSGSIDDLRNQFFQDRETLLRTQKIYLAALIPICCLLLALAAYLGLMLYRNYRQLCQSNTRLQRDNEDAQAQLIQTAKMSALGQMVAGVAHEINTPLAYVKATFSVLGDTLTSTVAAAEDQEHFAKLLQACKLGDHDPDAPTVFDDINILLQDGMHGVEQISSLVKAMKKFSRLDQEKEGEFSISELLDNALLISRYKLKNVVEIIRDFQEIPDVSCSPSQISQVFLNILTNAAQAMGDRPAKGVIHVRTAREGTDKVRIDIADDGPGIPAAIVPKIFDPFFTTKKVGEGTGLGLSICYRIVRNHGGNILVQTQEGLGTTFTIILPTGVSEPTPAQQRVLAGAVLH